MSSVLSSIEKFCMRVIKVCLPEKIYLWINNRTKKITLNYDCICLISEHLRDRDHLNFCYAFGIKPKAEYMFWYLVEEFVVEALRKPQLPSREWEAKFKQYVSDKNCTPEVAEEMAKKFEEFHNQERYYMFDLAKSESFRRRVDEVLHMKIELQNDGSLSYIIEDR